MTEADALARMVAPGTPRASKWLAGVIQLQVTRACDKACYGCTTGSNTRHKPWFMTPAQFETAVLSLKGYSGVYGLFGGNPATSKYFEDYCHILQTHVPFKQRGLWCNNPLGKGKLMRATFNHQFSNLNCHLDRAAYDEFKRDWPESMPFGLDKDSRHSPPFVAMKDVIEDEGRRWELISSCDINHFWSASITLFRGELRAYFCELAGSMASMHEDDPDYPDTGLDPAEGYDRQGRVNPPLNIVDDTGRVLSYEELGVPRSLYWWELGMLQFRHQVRKHCHDCGVPLRGYGELAQADDTHAEQVSETHANVYRPKRPARRVEVVTDVQQLGMGRLTRMTEYLQNSTR